MAAPSIRQLDHVTLIPRDAERTRQWWCEVLGATPRTNPFPPSFELGGVTIDLFEATGEQQPSPGTRGQHYAFTIPLEDYDAWIDHLRSHGIEPFLGNHGPGRMSIYLEDPDGYHVELTVLFDDLERGRMEIERRGIKRYTLPPGRQDRE